MRSYSILKTWIFIIPLVFFSCSSSKRSVTGITPDHQAVDREIIILAVNDMHATLDNFPRLAFMVDSLRAIYPDLLLMSAGDNQTGNPVNDQYPEKGMPIIELMNGLKFDVCALGNHEFDTKPDGFSRTLKRATFDFICANAMADNSDKHPFKPYKTFVLPNGIRIAVVSVLDINETGIPDTHPDNTKGFSFLDPMTTAQKYLDLKDNNDILIYLNHFGFENDVQLANQLPRGKVDLIIGGHSHTKIDKEQLHNGVLITQAERKLKYATLIKMKLHPDGMVSKSMQLLTVGKKGNISPAIKAMVDVFNDNPRLNEKIAESLGEFESYEKIGYLMTDALRSSAGSEIGLINPGGVRIDKLEKGPVSVMDVYFMDPFGNEIVLFKLSGAEIKRLFKMAYKFDENRPIYPSGMKAVYTMTSGGEVANVDIYTPDGVPMQLDRIYTVAMNNYMATVYDYEHNDPGISLFKPTAESMIEYLKALKIIPSYENEKRIDFIR